MQCVNLVGANTVCIMSSNIHIQVAACTLTQAEAQACKHDVHRSL